MNLKSVAFGLAAAACLAVSAQAAPVTFDFAAASSGSWSNSLFYSQDGIDLTVTAGTTNGGTAKVRTWKNAGLGACNELEQNNGCPNGQHQVDSVGLDEVVKLSFSKAVTITQIVFNYVYGSGDHPHDTFDFIVDGVLTLDNQDLADSWTATHNFDPVLAGTVFGVGAGTTSVQKCKKGYCWNETFDSAFKIKSITVEMAAIPVPAAGLMLAGGLGLLAAARRRRAA
jgi:hypothetical protein